MARKQRVVLPNRCYHIVSRIAHRAFFLDDEEKQHFVDFMKRAAAFSGVKLLGWCVMSNHFHILIYLPEAKPLTEEQLRVRIGDLYRGPQLVMALMEWERLKKESERHSADGAIGSTLFDDFKARLRRRMFHPGEFMKTLKQYATISFNGRRSHSGTLWENRYRCKISKPNVKNMSRQLAYVDCNPCEAGICGDPSQYAWSGWHAAVCGDDAAREMYRFVYCGESYRQEGAETEMSWEDIVEIHEQAIRERLGEITGSNAAGEEVDWMFARKLGGGELPCDDCEATPCHGLPSGWEMTAPEKRKVQLVRGKGEIAERILSVVAASGEMSAGEILESLGFSSRSFLLSAYLKPMVAQGFLALSLPDKPSSKNQKYRIPSSSGPQCIDVVA